jgi:hypothetical protein
MRKSPRSHRTRRVKEILDRFNVIVTMRCAYQNPDSKVQAVRKLAEDSFNPAVALEQNNSHPICCKSAANSQSTLESKRRRE